MLQWKRKGQGNYYSTQYMFNAYRTKDQRGRPVWALRRWIGGTAYLRGVFRTLADAKQGAEAVIRRLNNATY